MESLGYVAAWAASGDRARVRSRRWRRSLRGRRICACGGGRRGRRPFLLYRCGNRVNLGTGGCRTANGPPPGGEPGPRLCAFAAPGSGRGRGRGRGSGRGRGRGRFSAKATERAQLFAAACRSRGGDRPSGGCRVRPRTGGAARPPAPRAPPWAEPSATGARGDDGPVVPPRDHAAGGQPEGEHREGEQPMNPAGAIRARSCVGTVAETAIDRSPRRRAAARARAGSRSGAGPGTAWTRTTPRRRPARRSRRPRTREDVEEVQQPPEQRARRDPHPNSGSRRRSPTSRTPRVSSSSNTPTKRTPTPSSTTKYRTGCASHSTSGSRARHTAAIRAGAVSVQRSVVRRRSTVAIGHQPRAVT